MQKLQKKKSWWILSAKRNVLLINVVNSKQIELESAKRPTLFLLSLLNGKLEKTQITTLFARHFPKFGEAWAGRYIELLINEGIVEERKHKHFGLDAEYLCGLDRQLEFLESLENGKTAYENQLVLKKTRVAVLGLGSISQYILLPLLASGVGFFRCVDFDIVENRNVGRQPIFRPNDVGKTKTWVVSEYLKRSRPSIEVEKVNKRLSSEKDIEEVIHDCDFVLQCCDLPRFLIHRWIAAACIHLNKENILAYSGRVGPLNIPGETACYGCLEVRMKKQFVQFDNLVKVIANSGSVRFPELAVVGPLSGTLAAAEVVGHLLGLQQSTHNGFFDINPFSLKINYHQLARQETCRICS